MKLLHKIDMLGQYYSFNVFAFNGLNIILTKICTLLYYNSCSKIYTDGSWLASIAWLKFILGCFIFAIFIFAFIIWLLECAFNFKINNKIIVNNIYIKIIRLFLAIISTYYIIINSFGLTYTMFTIFI